MKKNITGFLGVSNGAKNNVDRSEDDFYANEPISVKLLLNEAHFDVSEPIWECACGMGHMSQELINNGYKVRSSDLKDRGFPSTEILDFLSTDNKDVWSGNIITSPPFKYAKDFIYKSMELLQPNRKLAFLLRIQFLESADRKELFDNYPPKYVYVSRNRLKGSRNGDFSDKKNVGNAMALCWFIWEKGYTGDTILKWFN